jgi:hypothetical protein
MKRLIVIGWALCAWLAWAPAQAQIVPVYDAFSGDHIDPAKWIATPMCESNAYDCAREVQFGSLRLAVRGYGDRGSDAGDTAAQSQLLFAHPETIGTIRIRFMVTSFSNKACAGNPDVAAHAQLLVNGTFFNDGVNDVSAFLFVERRTDDLVPPATLLRIGAFLSTGSQVELGSVRVGEPAVATLRWEPANNRFVVQVVRTFTKPFVVEQVLPYAGSDAAPPVVPFKSLQVVTFAPNCTGEQTFAAMEAKIDSVGVSGP